ncbi:MAG TPA: glycoside hydrolase family 28 protein [Bryobacteraceae bacterium]
MTRRTFLQRTALWLPTWRLVRAQVSASAPQSDPQSQQDAILARIKAPDFPKRDFNITKYGAKGDGKFNSTPAIHQAIAACTKAGGGRVVVPSGRFLTGAVHLDSNVNLYLDEGATLAFSQDPKDFLPVVYTRFEGTECMNYSPFIYAFEKENIGISGPGTVDGKADCGHWWNWVGRASCGGGPGKPNHSADRKAVTSMGDRNVPVKERVFGEGHYLRPNFIQPNRCTNVVIEDITIKNSPMWEVNPVLCKNVTVRNLHIDTDGPNNDGVDPESSTDVLIENCHFKTGDDCIAIKSGRNEDGRRVGVPCANIIVKDCNMADGHGGVSIGSEVSGGIRNVFVDNCQMDSPHLQRALRIKTNSYRGGKIENINFRNTSVGQVAEAVIEVDYFYEEGQGGPFLPTVENIYIANVTSKKSKHGLYLHGNENDPIRGLTVVNCNFEGAAQGNYLENVSSVSLKDVIVNGQAVKI